jgi:uncharacterized protein YbaR (Trm112 family)
MWDFCDYREVQMHYEQKIKKGIPEMMNHEIRTRRQQTRGFMTM